MNDDPIIAMPQRPYPRSSDLAFFLSRALQSTIGFYRYWDQKRGTRRMPARRDIDPYEMKRWLAGMQLIDVYYNPLRLVYRLVGQLDVDFRGYNPTGRTVEECYLGESFEQTMTNYNIAITQKTFVYDHADSPGASGLVQSQECILLPLSDDDEVVNMVMTFAEVEAL
jgi:hypothetical protein